jgi:hypothetical protein
MGTGILSIALPIAVVIAAPFFRNVFDMRREKNYREMVGSVFWGVVPFGVICVIWAASGDSPVRAQNMVLGLVGAAIGASGMIWVGYFVRDMSAKAEPPGPSSSGPASTQMGAVNNQGIVTQGQFGNNTIINPAFPNYSGTLTPKATLLFSPNKDEASYIPKLQFGTSNVIYGAKEIGLESPYGSLYYFLL